MTEAEETEMAFWQSRCEDMQVALETVREHRNALQEENTALKDGLKMYSSMVDRMKIAMSQGAEL